jgi:hypothetical protein
MGLFPKEMLLKSSYHLVMTNSLPWKIHPFLRTVNPGKPSISMGHLYHGYVKDGKSCEMHPFLMVRISIFDNSILIFHDLQWLNGSILNQHIYINKYTIYIYIW